jgi:hypothetical protein
LKDPCPVPRASAGRGRAQAELVADTITAGRPGFWPIALRIVEAFPRDKALQEDLDDGIEHRGLMIGGPMSVHHERCGREVGAVRSDPTTPRAALAWLERVEQALRLQAERELLREVEENVNELRRVVEDPAGPELWAVRTLLRLGKIDEALQISSKEELLRSIAALDLTGPAKRELRRRINRLG